MRLRLPLLVPFFFLLLSVIIFTAGCADKSPTPAPPTVPRSGDWGIYSLDPETGNVELLYGSDDRLNNLDPDASDTRFLYTCYVGGQALEDSEIYLLDITAAGATRLTDNDYPDLYPVWSPDYQHVAFLAWPGADLDVYIMDADGTDRQLLHSSAGHDADIDWVDGNIVFTAASRIWLMRDDGTGVRPLTDPPRAGEWGDANLPFGDYDPRLSPDGTTVVFERLMDDTSPHGNYDIFTIGADGSGETRLTDTGYAQGIVNWSPAGDKMVFVVAAINDIGKYDIYTMNADGSDLVNVTPDYFPEGFLCHSPVFSRDGRLIYFVGEWFRPPAG